MKIEKKLSLLVASLILVLFLLNVTSAIVTDLGIEDPLTTSRNSVFSPSDTIEFLETTIQLAGTPGLSNWYTSDVTVTFLVSGTVLEFTTAYSYDNTNWISYDGPFVESKEGYTTIYYNSTDSEGYAEATKETTIQIDKTAPEISLDTERIPGDGVLVTITVIEDVSPISDIGYILDEGEIKRYAPFPISTEGTHSVYYWAEDAAGNKIDKLDSVEVVIGPAITPTEVSYTGDISGVYSDPINLEAKLIDLLTGVPIPGKWIVFSVGAQTESAFTDSEGIAVSTLVIDQPAGIYDVIASFEGDEEYLASSVTHEFTIAKEQAFTFYSGLTIIEETDSTITLMTTVLDDSDDHWGDLTKIYVTFTIYLSSDQATPLQIMDSIPVSTTDLAGVGIATVEILTLAEGEYIIVVSLNPEQNHYYWSQDSDPTIITIYQPGHESVRGAGWIEDSDGNRGHFVFLVKHTSRGGLKGFIFYTLRVDNLVYFVKSTEITGFTIYENHAFFEASITIYMYDLETKEKTQLEDTYSLRIDAWDSKRRHGKDIFQIQIYDRYGFVMYEAGYDPLGYVHRGNIVIHGHGHHRHHGHHWHHRHHRQHYHKMRHC